MKKIYIIFICLSLCLFTGCNFFNVDALDAVFSEENSENGFWVRSESYFLDYTIVQDKIQIRYSFCFQNLSKYDLRVNGFVTDFRKRDLKGWLKYEKSYIGKLANGEKDLLILSGEKKHVVIVYEGEYLGGKVNTDFYINHIIVGQRIEKTGDGLREPY